jgi:hypothetical protein
MKLSNRRLWIFGAIAIGAIILITLLAAPANNQLNSGSTYNRAAPDGYGAWYAFMSERGTPIQRWRKPFEDLADDEEAEPPDYLVARQQQFDRAKSFLKKRKTGLRAAILW